MKRVGLSPKTGDFLTNDWFALVGERLNVYSGISDPSVAEVPENQWVLYRNTTSDEVRVWANIRGVLQKSAPLSPTDLFPGVFKTDVIQLGDSATASQNLTIQTNADGTFTIARGNAGATTQDILTIDANGRIVMPQNVVTFRAYQSASQSIPNITWTKLTFNTKDFDTGGYWDTVNNRFLPLVSGYYSITLCGEHSATAGGMCIDLRKTGTRITVGAIPFVTGIGTAMTISTVIYLNGSTDYIEAYMYQTSGGAANTSSGNTETTISGYLIAEA